MSLRVVVVGCGFAGAVWTRYGLRRPYVELVALVDVDEAAARRLRDEYALSCPAFTELRECLEARRPDIVFNTTPPARHFEVIEASLAEGCHVFSEKPLAPTLDEARRLISAAEANGRLLAIMQNRRYAPQLRALRAFLEEHAERSPLFVCADFFKAWTLGGFREQMPSPLLVEMAVHTFDQARYLIGTRPVSVWCHEFSPAGSWLAGNAAAVCTFEFENGSVFSFRGSWCAEGHETEWDGSWRVTTRRLTVLWDSAGAPHCEARWSGGDRPHEGELVEMAVPCAPAARDPHDQCLDDMFEALLEGRRPETDCRENVWTVAMLDGALRSAATGAKISLAC
jgi:predicted dehydrogenase